MYNNICIFLEYNTESKLNLKKIIHVGLSFNKCIDIILFTKKTIDNNIIKLLSSYKIHSVYYFEYKDFNCGNIAILTKIKLIMYLLKQNKYCVLLFENNLNNKELATHIGIKTNNLVITDCINIKIINNEKISTLHYHNKTTQNNNFINKKLINTIIHITKPNNLFIATINNFLSIKLPLNLHKNPPQFINMNKIIKNIDTNIITKILKQINSNNITNNNIENANIIIAIGNGIKNKTSLNDIYTLANLLSAEIGGTRPIINKGWLPISKMIGSSGIKVNPKLYIACGISGSTHHTIGITNKNNCMIIAINNDKTAPIFSISNYGIVNDVNKIILQIINILNKKKENEY